MTGTVHAAVVDAVARQKQLDPTAIRPDSRLSTLGVSSLDAITIVYEIEEAFDIEVPNESLEGLETVEDIVDRLNSLISR